MDNPATDDCTQLPPFETLPSAPPRQPTVRYNIEQYYQARTTNAVLQGDPLHHYDEYAYRPQANTNWYHPIYDPNAIPDAMEIATDGSSQYTSNIDNAVNQSYIFTDSSLGLLGIQTSVPYTPVSLGTQTSVPYTPVSLDIQTSVPYTPVSLGIQSSVPYAPVSLDNQDSVAQVSSSIEQTHPAPVYNPEKPGLTEVQEESREAEVVAVNGAEAHPDQISPEIEVINEISTTTPAGQDYKDKTLTYYDISAKKCHEHNQNYTIFTKFNESILTYDDFIKYFHEKPLMNKTAKTMQILKRKLKDMKSTAKIVKTAIGQRYTHDWSYFSKGIKIFVESANPNVFIHFNKNKEQKNLFLSVKDKNCEYSSKFIETIEDLRRPNDSILIAHNKRSIYEGIFAPAFVKTGHGRLRGSHQVHCSKNLVGRRKLNESINSDKPDHGQFVRQPRLNESLPAEYSQRYYENTIYNSLPSILQASFQVEIDNPCSIVGKEVINREFQQECAIENGEWVLIIPGSDLHRAFLRIGFSTPPTLFLITFKYSSLINLINALSMNYTWPKYFTNEKLFLSLYRKKDISNVFFSNSYYILCKHHSSNSRVIFKVNRNIFKANFLTYE